MGGEAHCDGRMGSWLMCSGCDIEVWIKGVYSELVWFGFDLDLRSGRCSACLCAYGWVQRSGRAMRVCLWGRPASLYLEFRSYSSRP